MSDGTRPGGNGSRRKARRFHRLVPRPGIAGRNCADHSGAVEPVDGLREEVAHPVGSAAQAHVGDVESQLIRTLQGVQDVLRPSVCERAWEDIEVAEHRSRGDARWVVRDVDGPARWVVDPRGRVCVAGSGASDVRAVTVQVRRAEAGFGKLVVEGLCVNDLVVGATVGDIVRSIPFWIPGVAEAGMPYVDAGVDDRDLDALTGALR